MTAKSNQEGIIRVPLPMTVPEHLNLSSFDTFDPLAVDLPIDKILKSGLTAVVNADHNLDTQSQPPDVPGQVVIVTRKLTAKDRIGREFP